MSLQIDTGDKFRNVFCPSYNDCLNKTVRENLPGWDCSICESRDKEEFFDYTEADRCRELINRIFFVKAGRCAKTKKERFGILNKLQV